ncbi:DNA-processing protein DprA [Roseovarius atlanticus]|uniref:DNA-processing protein DprA n=1 Tax=Roseovarius atlanticus TaxID=1641875 RepID=UPI001C976985|nr:DNA-processing protein DprA [Roseovarius atlanticus]MBY5987610.1 DNA-processing protein DprA [Roseovarius atlanticus]MBY6123001.1 DNA-processing protein DprA [Roseovarius atlanticus]MBY6147497.1 DNA-processing protein DprA [Roseovarius atlanticus]
MSEELHPSTHPPLPPTTEDDRVAWLRLLRSRRVGPATFHRLMQEHGSAQAALEALPEVARAAGVENYAACPVGVAEAELKAGAALGARLIFIGTPDYPDLLAETPDAPPFLWAVGDGAPLLQRPMVALVGARNASSLGLRMAKALAGALSERGLVVVSGLARGIDAASHLAALDHGTLAVVAGGIDVMYPAENTKLAEDIARTGLRLSEQPIGTVPQARHFPARNRIISGLAQAVVVVEAAARSGSLITARNALDQGRDVLAVPGHPFDARAAGCNMLIRDGATLVRNADDVLAALPARAEASAPPQPDLPLAPPPEKRSLAETTRLHSDILNRLGPAPLAEDQLIRDLSAPAARVSPALTDLEVSGKITRHPGGLVSRS